MITSDELMYIEGEFGIRIENEISWKLIATSRAILRNANTLPPYVAATPKRAERGRKKLFKRVPQDKASPTSFEPNVRDYKRGYFAI